MKTKEEIQERIIEHYDKYQEYDNSELLHRINELKWVLQK